MRIGYVCMDAGIPVFGCKGASVHVQGIVAALRRAGHEVTLLATRLGEERPPLSRDVDVVCLPVSHSPTRPHGAPWIAAINKDLFRALQAHGPYHAIYERYSLWSFGAMEYARHAGIPGILEVNAPLIEEQATHRGLTDRVGAERVAGRVFQAATQIVAVSQEVADYVNRHPCTMSQAEVEANGFDPERFPEAPRRPTHRPFTIGFLGTLKPWHGVNLLAEILTRVRASVPHARLLIVGDGPERERLSRDFHGASGTGSVEFAGAVSPGDVGTWLHRMDVAVAPYPADAPFYFSPLKVVEYMAAGVPPIASALGQIPALIRHGATGLLVAPGDARGFAEACLRLEREPALRAQLGQSARAEAMSSRTWDAVAHRVLGRSFGGGPRSVEAI